MGTGELGTALHAGSSACARLTVVPHEHEKWVCHLLHLRLGRRENKIAALRVLKQRALQRIERNGRATALLLNSVGPVSEPVPRCAAVQPALALVPLRPVFRTRVAGTNRFRGPRREADRLLWWVVMVGSMVCWDEGPRCLRTQRAAIGLKPQPTIITAAPKRAGWSISSFIANDGPMHEPSRWARSTPQ